MLVGCAELSDVNGLWEQAYISVGDEASQSSPETQVCSQSGLSWSTSHPTGSQS